jgi:hypothetical protein
MSFRLKEELMTVFVSEFNDLIFNGGAIARANSFNFAGIKW